LLDAGRVARPTAINTKIIPQNFQQLLGRFLGNNLSELGAIVFHQNDSDYMVFRFRTSFQFLTFSSSLFSAFFPLTSALCSMLSAPCPML
jgi:hypothetical protein